MQMKKKSGGPQEKPNNPNYAQQQQFCNFVDLIFVAQWMEKIEPGINIRDHLGHFCQ
jgi:hypothetical protein